jgi:hypothetical protein
MMPALTCISGRRISTAGFCFQNIFTQLKIAQRHPLDLKITLEGSGSTHLWIRSTHSRNNSFMGTNSEVESVLLQGAGSGAPLPGRGKLFFPSLPRQLSLTRNDPTGGTPLGPGCRHWHNLRNFHRHRDIHWDRKSRLPTSRRTCTTRHH